MCEDKVSIGVFAVTQNPQITYTIEKYHCEGTAERWAPLFQVCGGSLSKQTPFDLFQPHLRAWVSKA